MKLKHRVILNYVLQLWTIPIMLFAKFLMILGNRLEKSGEYIWDVSRDCIQEKIADFCRNMPGEKE